MKLEATGLLAYTVLALAFLGAMVAGGWAVDALRWVLG